MKTNSNSYTIIYSVIIVLIVAFLLAFVVEIYAMDGVVVGIHGDVALSVIAENDPL